MENEKDTVTQPKNKQPKERRERSIDKRQALLHDRQNPTPCLRYIDLFAGVGGFRLGIERATNRSSREYLSEQTRSGEHIQPERDKSDNKSERTETKQEEHLPKSCCVFTSEIDKYAIRTYNKNFGTDIQPNDITKQDSDSIEDFDLLCAGFPCQSFSIAGKRKGFEDTRGTMFFEIVRIIKAKGPKYLLLENVKGLLNHDKGKTFRFIIQTLQELGYDVQWMVFNSKFFGVPQNRERVFIIGNLRGTSRPEILPLGECDREVKDLVYYQKSDREIARIYDPKGIAPTLHLKTGGWQEPKIVASRGRSPMNLSDGTAVGSTEQKLEVNSEGICNNLTSVQKDHMVMRGASIRRLTPIECERLQGFPDNWTEGVSDTQRYKQMGNAVTVNVVEAIIKKWFVFTGTDGRKGVKK